MLVFYTGNTFHQPGDVLSLSGDRVGAETRRVTLARVVNRRTSAAACHAQPAYNANAAAPAFFPVSLSAQTEPAIDAEILQATEDSIKLRMPARAGIYQASLYGAAGELLQSVWLNLPQLETVLGDNGDSVSPGGLIRLAGYRLCPADAPLPAEVRLRNAAQTVVLSPEAQDAPYALSVRLPEDIPEGEYELSLHSGYGDDGCWAAPRGIRIRASFLKGIPRRVFNVRDYGAKGVGAFHNDTAGILAALSAARENGGGTVYFPHGNYLFTYLLDIPQNVEIKGDGVTKTSLTFLPYLWDLNQLPPQIIHLCGSNYVHDLDISGMRVSTLFGANDAADIRIERLTSTFIPFCGGPSVTDTLGDKYSHAQLKMKVAQEASYYRSASGEVMFRFYHCRNIFLDTIALCSDDMTAHQFPRCENVYLGHSKFSGQGGAVFGCANAYIEHNDYHHLAINLALSHSFFAYNTAAERMDNNREIMTTDCYGLYCDSPRDESHIWRTDNRKDAYRLQKSFADGALTGCLLLLTAGRGAGQVRRIAENHADRIALEQPFAVPPKDGATKALIFNNHADNIVFKNHFENGGAFQFYGLQLHTVIAENTFKKVFSMDLTSGFFYNTVHPHWYVSFAGNRLYDITVLERWGYSFDMVSGMDVDRIQSRLCVRCHGGRIPNQQRSNAFSGNLLEDGYGTAL